VRILESPTNGGDGDDGYEDEDDDTAEKGKQKEQRPPSISPVTASTEKGVKTQQGLKSPGPSGGAGTGPSTAGTTYFRRVSSSTRLKHHHHHHVGTHGHGVTRHSSLTSSHRSSSTSNLTGIGSLNNALASQSQAPPTAAAPTTATSTSANSRAASARLKRNGSSSSSTAHLVSNGSSFTLSQPKSYTRGFEVPPHLQQQQQLASDAANQHQAPAAAAADTPASGVAVTGAKDVPHPPPPSPESLVPASVILPKQPNPSPCDSKYLAKTIFIRPVSPPLSAASGSLGNSAGKGTVSPITNNAIPTPLRHAKAPASNQSVTPRGTPAATTSTAAVPVVPPPPAGVNTAKKSKMFFFSSPQTDSDDEVFSASVGRRNKGTISSPIAAAAAAAATAVPEVAAMPPQQQAAAPAQAQTQARGDSEEEEEDDDDDFDDDDDSEWSSEISESEGEEAREAARQEAAARAAALEEERQREMFAKRVPSQVKLALADASGRGGGLLSQLLHPEQYPRNFQALPTALRNNKSAVELQRARPSDTAIMGLGMVHGTSRPAGAGAGGNSDGRTLMVTGLQSSKSAAALPNLNRMRSTASKNGLTRLGGVPHGVEFESDDSDEEEDDHYHNRPAAANVGSGSGSGSAGASSQGTGPVGTRGDSSSRSRERKQRTRDFSSSQHERLAGLMHKRNDSSTLKTVLSSSSIAAPVVSHEPIQVALPYQTNVNVPPGVGQAFTPRTTRRNMLATELTESLRMNLIWERQTRNANTGKGAMAGLGGMVAAVGNRLAGRSTPQQPQPEAQPDGSRPRVQRGSSLFQHARPEDGNADVANATAPYGYTMPARPPPNPSGNLRSSSDPSQNHDYYSPGFHHV